MTETNRNDGRVLDALFATIKSRRGGDADASWTARLLAEAPQLPAEKLTEEAGEAAAEAIKGDNPALTREAADVLYHLLVVLASRDVALGDVWDELRRREGQSGIAEKQSRKTG